MRTFLTSFFLMMAALPLAAQSSAPQPAVVWKDAGALSMEQISPGTDSTALVPAEAVSAPSRKERFLPMHRRIDREIDKNKFVYKGEVMLGVTASYGTISSDDTDFLLVLEHIDADGTMATVNPFFGYAYRDNRCIGIRFGYRHIDGRLGNLGFNLGEQNDLSGSLDNMALTSDNFSLGLFHRSYVGLDARGRFGLFAELEASFSTGTSQFSYLSGDEPRQSNSSNLQLKLAFNPGLAVYIFPNVCGTLSFGLGGIQYSHVTQEDDAGNEVGSRNASKMRFRLNLADINIGITIHLWDKKKR